MNGKSGSKLVLNLYVLILISVLGMLWMKQMYLQDFQRILVNDILSWTMMFNILFLLQALWTNLVDQKKKRKKEYHFMAADNVSLCHFCISVFCKGLNI